MPEDSVTNTTNTLKVNIDDINNLNYWSNKLNVSSEDLKMAMSQVGHFLTDVETYFRDRGYLIGKEFDDLIDRIVAILKRVTFVVVQQSNIYPLEFLIDKIQHKFPEKLFSMSNKEINPVTDGLYIYTIIDNVYIFSFHEITNNLLRKQNEYKRHLIERIYERC